MDITEKLRNRINELYQNYMTVLLGRSKREIIDRAEDIAFVKKITDLIDDDAEELPNAFAYKMQCSDHLFYELLGLWHNAEPNRREDEREALRALIMEHRTGSLLRSIALMNRKTRQTKVKNCEVA